ncbi:MAG: Tat pathway signal sequence protein [Myxococcaceae bacterium]|nr:Tat pathway signal sequence protein [Myxococcaceae bacterium]
MTIRLRRRSFLVAAGTLLALPALEAMGPGSGVARAATPAGTPRFMTFHFPIGVNRAAWKPSGTETSWTLGASQVDLAPHKNDITVITGVNNSGDKSGTAGHTCNAATFLTGGDVPRGIHAMGTSADQLIAASLVGKTPFRSLELGTSILNENPNAEAGYDPVLKDHLSWSNGTPLPKEINPSALFDRLFAGGTSTVGAAEAARRRHFGQSVIDAVRGDATRLQSRLGKDDNAKLDEYLSGVRDLELRIQSTATAAVCTPGARPGPPADVRDRVKQMLDLSVLAFSCDLTRVITFGYEHTVTEQSHPWVGVKDGYHIGVTHNQPGQPYAAVNQWIVSQLAYLLAKLKATPAALGTGTLLDNTIVYFASELGEGSSHSASDIPIIVAGKGAGKISQQGRLLARSGQGNGNVLIALMQAMGVSVPSFGNGFTTPLAGLVA